MLIDLFFFIALIAWLIFYLQSQVGFASIKLAFDLIKIFSIQL